ncbi:DUF7344 domain-containing protein [Salinigranum salinum]|uniref:DUF7344 domain-containing protein n=1 Tax=Salinigranum salinum TaxID=1364937 RepID=UPI0012611239|nr:hypothetical protein [Salinigranum salinum]
MGRQPEGPTDDDEVQREVDEYVRGLQPPPEELLEMDFLFESLSHPRRRYLIYSLLSDTKWTLRELSTKLVAWEQDITEEAVTDIDRDEMLVSLYHLHVPKLIEHRIIEYMDEKSTTIVTAENATQVLAALEGLGASVDADQESHARRDYKEE